MKPMVVYLIMGAGLFMLGLAGPVNAEELPDYLYSKGGIIYPRTGDSTQEIFHTPPNAREIFKPGMLVGVLPQDCRSASRGGLGEVYICHHDLVLKPEEHHGRSVYRVIEFQ